MANVQHITRIIDISSKKFNRLTAIRVSGVYNKKVKWLCLCDCGKEVIVDSYSLRNGHVKSCGCFRSEVSSKNGKNSILAAQQANLTHGYAKKDNVHPLWNIWYGMKQRCHNSYSNSYCNYGARSISVCDDWMDSGTFISWALENGWKKGLQIDRIDNNGNYCPENCRIVTRKINLRNTRSNRLICYNNRMMTIAELSELTGIERSRLAFRIKNDWPIEDVVNSNRIRHFYRRPKE